MSVHRLAVAVAAVVTVAFSACGGPGGASGGGSANSGKPTLEGALAFDAGSAQYSTQTSGGGFTGGDNLSIRIGEGCGSGDRSVSLSLYSRDHSTIKAGTITVERRNASTGGNLFANVGHDDFSGTPVLLDAVSGTVTLDAVDFSALRQTKGSFDVVMELKDGGTSPLKGTFDLSWLCR